MLPLLLGFGLKGRGGGGRLLFRLVMHSDYQGYEKGPGIS